MWIDIIIDEISGFNSDKEIEFQNSQRIITSIVNRYIKKIKIKNVSKIAISLFKQQDIDFISSPNALLGVITINKSFDVDSILTLQNQERKKQYSI